jgi:hypothetical protein
MRGLLSDAAYREELGLVRTTLETLQAGGASHWREYLAAWPPE